MQILTVLKGFEAFECKFQPYEWDLKHSDVNSNYWEGILTIRMQILTIWKEFDMFECKFKPFELKFKSFEPNSKHAFECKF